MSFFCHNCGEEWEKHPATIVPCPTCHAPAGRFCVRPSEHQAWEIHVKREQLAVDQKLMTRCPNPTPNNIKKNINTTSNPNQYKLF